MGRRFTNPWEAIYHRSEWRGECVVWVGCRQPSGHGQFRTGGKPHKVHRWLYEQLIGTVPEGKYLDHICRVASCIRLEHLRVVTHAQNMQNLGIRADNSSGFRGVSWSVAMRKWRSAVEYLGVTHIGGYFDEVEDANASAISLRNKLFTHNEEDRR